MIQQQCGRWLSAPLTTEWRQLVNLKSFCYTARLGSGPEINPLPQTKQGWIRFRPTHSFLGSLLFFYCCLFFQSLWKNVILSLCTDCEHTFDLCDVVCWCQKISMSSVCRNNVWTFSFGHAEHRVCCEKNKSNLTTQHLHQSFDHVSPEWDIRMHLLNSTEYTQN